jgi:hypothetical protein
MWFLAAFLPLLIELDESFLLLILAGDLLLFVDRFFY